uniref:Uncharacterized protein n=1 Tax=Parascaris equorum TaxID=6256 RepID=A0A914RLP4_PAREQ
MRLMLTVDVSLPLITSITLDTNRKPCLRAIVPLCVAFFSYTYCRQFMSVMLLCAVAERTDYVRCFTIIEVVL